MTRNRQKHNFRSRLNRRKREIEARKWGHTDTARLIVCAPTWERGVGRQLPRSGITDLGLEVFWKKGENKLLNVEEFRGGSGGGTCVDLSALKTFRLRHSFVAYI